MKILHILNDGPTLLSDRIIEVHKQDHEVKLIDLSQKGVSYENLIDDIFSHDKVISW
jgi:hypothetical protein